MRPWPGYVGFRKAGPRLHHGCEAWLFEVCVPPPLATLELSCRILQTDVRRLPSLCSTAARALALRWRTTKPSRGNAGRGVSQPAEESLDQADADILASDLETLIGAEGVRGRDTPRRRWPDPLSTDAFASLRTMAHFNDLDPCSYFSLLSARDYGACFAHRTGAR